MAILADSLVGNSEEVQPGKWAVARPIIQSDIITRVKDAWKVLTGRAIAVYFGRDVVRGR